MKSTKLLAIEQTIGTIYLVILFVVIDIEIYHMLICHLKNYYDNQIPLDY